MSVLSESEYFQKGISCFDNKEYKNASKLFSMARTLEPNNIKIIEFQVGVSRILDGNAKAVELAKQMVIANNKDYRGYYILGKLYVDLNELNLAEKNIKKSLEYSPNDVLATEQFIEILKRRNNYEKAYVLVVELINHHIDDFRVYWIAAKVGFRINKIDEINEYLCKARNILDRSPNKPATIGIIKLQLEICLVSGDFKYLDDLCNYLIICDKLIGYKERAKCFDFIGDNENSLKFYILFFEEKEETDVLLKIIDHFIISNELSKINYYMSKLEILSKSKFETYKLIVNRFIKSTFPNVESREIDPKTSIVSDTQIDYARNLYDIYTTKHKITGSLFYRNDDLSIYVIEGLSNSVRVYTALDVPDNSYFFVLVPEIISENKIKNQLGFFHYVTNNKFSSERIIFLSNTEADVNFLRKLGMTQSFMCNQNCWIDYNLFNIEPKEKIFDMVLNTRPEYGTKRPYLAMGIQNLAVIKGNLVRINDYWNLEQLKPKFINNGRLSQKQVVEILNQSYSGGIFSYKEGACYSSSEYLFCGIPVISTDSLGGRDYWYNSDNSIIVSTEEGDVLKAVKKAKEMVISGEFDSNNIRKNHIDKSLILRDKFITVFEKILLNNSITENPRDIFEKEYCHQFKKISIYVPGTV